MADGLAEFIKTSQDKQLAKSGYDTRLRVYAVRCVWPSSLLAEFRREQVLLEQCSDADILVTNGDFKHTFALWNGCQVEILPLR